MSRRALSACLISTTALATTFALESVSPAAAAVGDLKITEVAAWGSGNSAYAADWFELTNTTASAIDITGWRMDDSSAAVATSLALNGITSIPAGKSVIFLESANPTSITTAFVASWFGGTVPAGLQIGTYTGAGAGLSTGGDGVNIFDTAGVVQASVSFGTSPAAAPFATFDNTAGVNNAAISTLSVAGVNGAFLVSTGTPAIGSPGTAMAGGTGGTTTTTTTTVPTGTPWPGGSALDVVDLAGLATENLSGLTYEGSGSATPGTLWAVLNNPSLLFKLQFDGTNWVPAFTKTLTYPDGTGIPDSEGVTMVGNSSAGGLFVATERNNAASGTSRNAIMRFDPTAPGSTISATQIWDITTDIPSNGANLGLEAITWVPDTFLVAQGLRDQVTNAAYNPALYANHGNGLFFVGVEFTGNIHAYALNLGGTTFTRVATFSSGFPSVMALEFDPDTGDFWAHCDNGCQNRSTVLRVSPQTGNFGVVSTFDRPAAMPASANTEGFAIAPNTECVNNLKPVFWSDDGDTGGFSLRRGTLSCLAIEPPVVPEYPAGTLPLMLAVLAIGGFVVIARRRAKPVIV